MMCIKTSVSVQNPMIVQIMCVKKTTVLNSVQNPKNLPMIYIPKMSYMNIPPNPWGFRVMSFMVVPRNVPDISKRQSQYESCQN